MKKLLNELNRINEVLQELDNTEKNIIDLPYYSISGNESERQKDLARVKQKRASYLDKKHTVLENIQLACEKEKFVVSAKQRTLKVA